MELTITPGGKYTAKTPIPEKDKLLVAVMDYMQKEMPQLFNRKEGEAVNVPLRKIAQLFTSIAGDVILGKTPAIVQIFSNIDFEKALKEVAEIKKTM